MLEELGSRRAGFYQQITDENSKAAVSRIFYWIIVTAYTTVKLLLVIILLLDYCNSLYDSKVTVSRNFVTRLL